MTTSTPMKPTQMAASRRGPTHSPRIGPEASATTKGVAKKIDIVSDSCR